MSYALIRRVLSGGSMAKKTQIPTDFKVTDDHRRYTAEKWSLLYLPDQFLTDFIRVFTANRRPHYDWDLTFKNFIRRAAPSGEFYNPGFWERKCEQSRRHKSPQSSNAISPSTLAGHNGATRQHEGGGSTTRKSTWIPAKPETVKSHMKNIRELLGK